jgi:chromosome segregation ATPase
MEYKLNLSNTENKDLVSYCNLNDLRISEVIKKSYLEGFNIERYGLLNLGGNQEKQVEKEVIVEKRVEIPVEVIKEVVKVEYVEVEKPVEIIKEKVVNVIQEVPVEKIVYIYDKKEEEPVTNLDNICDKMEEMIFQKEQEILEITQKFSTKTTEMENIFQNEKKELLSKIQQLEEKEPEVREVIIEKESSDNNLKPKLDALQNTVQKLKQDNIDKDRKIKEYEKTIEEIQKFQQDKKAAFLKGSNLDDTLYK